MSKPVGRPPQDLTGQRFGKLVCIERLPVIPGKKARWKCLCDCGKETSTIVRNLRQELTKSCGCIQQARRASGWNRDHGMWLSVEYAAWHHMKQRCNDINHPAYHNYGGRGIKVCERWQNDFSAFLSDMGQRPSPKLSLERKDNDGPYSPGNCIWATRSQQGKNRRAKNKWTTKSARSKH